MEKKEGLEIEKAPEELTEQDLEKVNGGIGMDSADCDRFKCQGYGCVSDGSSLL